jgi:hypothetical protein
MTSKEPAFPRIASSQTTRVSPWVSLVENRVVAAPDDTGAIYHSIDTMDYVSVLAVTVDGRIPIVRMWTFFAPDVASIPDWHPEVEVAHRMVTIAELHALTLEGVFDHAPHVAMLGMAVMRGWIPPP